MNGETPSIPADSIRALINVFLVIVCGVHHDRSTEPGTYYRVAKVNKRTNGCPLSVDCRVCNVADITGVPNIMSHFQGRTHQLEMNSLRGSFEFKHRVLQFDLFGGRSIMAVKPSLKRAEMMNLLGIPYIIEIVNNSRPFGSRFYCMLCNVYHDLQGSRTDVQNHVVNFLQRHLSELWQILKDNKVFEADENLLKKFWHFTINKLSKVQDSQQQLQLVSSLDFLNVQRELAHIIQLIASSRQWDEKKLIKIIISQFHRLESCHKLLVRLKILLDGLLFAQDFQKRRLEAENISALIPTMMQIPSDSGAALMLNTRLRSLLKFGHIQITGRLESKIVPITESLAKVYEQLVNDIEDWLKDRDNIHDMMKRMLRNEIVDSFNSASDLNEGCEHSTEKVNEIMDFLIDSSFPNFDD